jgi:AsmA protein
MVQGPWEDPIMLPDPQSRIERSGAARPILDALKDRGTREAVRSAIERLTGAAPRPAEPTSPPAAPALAGSSAPVDTAASPAEPTQDTPSSAR